MSQGTLYTYFRSTAAYRVRIALNLKKVDVDYVYINLKPGVDQQLSDDYLGINPEGRVPFFSDDRVAIGQSSAILSYLDDRYTDMTLLPREWGLRGRVQQVSQLIASDVHPLNNLSVLQYLRGTLGQDEDAVMAWYAHWIQRGFAAVEKLLSDYGTAKGGFAFGRQPTMADVHIIPQVWNARRFNVPIDAFERILAIDAHAMALDAFQDAAPENQQDFKSNGF